MEWIEELKSASGTVKDNVVTGIILHKGNLDHDGDIIAKDASISFEPLLESGHVFFNHKRDELPIGVVLTDSIKDTDDYVEASFEFLSHSKAQDAKSWYSERLEKGFKTGLSVGMRHRNPRYEDGQRILTDIKIHEWSLVTFPANPLAVTKSWKGVQRKEHWDNLQDSFLHYHERVEALKSDRGADWREQRLEELARFREMVDKAIRGLEPMDEAALARIRELEGFTSDEAFASA